MEGSTDLIQSTTIYIRQDQSRSVRNRTGIGPLLKSNCLLTFKRVPSTCNSCTLYYVRMHTSNTEIPSNKFLGKLCSKGHDWNGTGKSLRFVKNAQRCVECEKQRRSTPAYREHRNKVMRERYQQDSDLRQHIVQGRSGEETPQEMSTPKGHM